MDLFALDSAKFIDLNLVTVGFLFIVGFIGGLVSGLIGSGGAFILTPGMMGLGVPGTVAVASNMCHKFPKALMGALKRFRYGQVDVKMGWSSPPRPGWACSAASLSSGISWNAGGRPVRTST